MLISSKLCEEIEKSIRSHPIDWRGHNRGGHNEETFDEFVKHILTCIHVNFSEEEYARIQAGEWIPIYTHALHCDWCEHDYFLETNGVSLRYKNECPNPKGIRSFHFELNIPSGVMLCANDLRHAYPIDEGKRAAATSFNRIRTARRYASAGLAHAFISSTTVSLFELSPDHFKLIRGMSYKGTRHFGFGGPLWWYSIADYEDYLSRCRVLAINPKTELQTVKVKPGVYRFTQYTACKSVFTDIQWVRDPS